MDREVKWDRYIEEARRWKMRKRKKLNFNIGREKQEKEWKAYNTAKI